MGNCREVTDGRGDWGGRGPGGARPPRWRRRAHARAPAPDLGPPQAGRRAPPAARRGPGAAVARAGRDRGRAERLARGVPGCRRGLAEEPACRRGRGRDRSAEGEGRRPDHGQRVARGQDRAPGDRPPFGLEEIEAVSRQVSPATERVYGLQRVTRVWGVSRATVYRHRRPAAVTRRRPGPLGAMADEELVEAIQQLLRDSPFHGEGYRKLWARLRFSGIRTSRRR